MEMPNFNGQTIISEALLAHVLEFCCLAGCPWVNYELRQKDRGALLKLLATLVSVSAYTRESAMYTMQLAALRLASHDVERVGGEFSPSQKMSYVLEGFDNNMELFSKDWELESPIPKHLRTSSLHELSAEELCRLRDLLCGGWNREIAARGGDGQSESPRVWLTPQHRN